MTKEIGLWIDRRQAVIVTLFDQEERIERITSDIEKHVQASRSGDDSKEDKRDVQDRRFDDHLGRYYDEVIAYLRDADSILLFGPGEAKAELQKQLEEVGLKPYDHTSYARFFTEMIELMINFMYVKVLSKRSKARVDRGQIAPQNKDQIESVKKSYKFYSLAYPLFLAISKIDALVGFTRGYAVVVVARKD